MHSSKAGSDKLKRLQEALLLKQTYIIQSKCLTKAIERKIEVPGIKDLNKYREQLRRGTGRLRKLLRKWNASLGITLTSKRVRRLTFASKGHGFTFAKNMIGITF